MSSPDTPTRRQGPTLAALLIGLPLAGAALAAFHFWGPLRASPAFRYVEHPSQWAEVVFFFAGIGALLVRLWALSHERRALRASLLPAWDGKPQPPEKAAELLAAVEKHPRGVRDTYLGRRLCGLLGFVRQRNSAADLDDQMRAAADTDAMNHDAGLGFIRFITWAIPILGFLGTVIGITTAISNVSPEQLETDMGKMTGGLAEAFDGTALALGLTMVLMFLNFLVERREQALLSDVDDLAERELGHRFSRGTAESAPVVEAIREQSAALLRLAAGPAAVAAETFEQISGRVLAGLQQGLDQTLNAHAERIAALEQQAVAHTAQLMQQVAQLAAAIRETGQQHQQVLVRVAEGVAAQAGAIGKLQEGEHHLVHLQAVLHQNLAAIASASNFEEAVHSLTAAVHLLTSRAGTPGPRLSTHGKAA